MSGYGLSLAAALLVLLLLAFTGDMLQYAVRVAASILEYPNLATHLVSLSMLVNRVGAAGALLLIGYSIDVGVGRQLLIMTYCACSIGLALLYAVMVRYADECLVLCERFIGSYYGVTSRSQSGDARLVRVSRGHSEVAILFVLGLSGFFLPSLAATFYPAYRATLLQTGFILNSVVTLYFALRTEKSIALVLNHGTLDEKWSLYLRFMESRAIGSLATAMLLLACALVLRGN